MSGENIETGLIRIFDIYDLHPSPDNDLIYRPADESDPEIRALAQSIKQRGILEPLVVTLDNFILSGHRRYAAAKLAKVRQVSCRVENIFSYDDDFLPRLREYNRQREKTLDEKWREEIVTADPEESYQALIQHREQQSRIDVESIEIDAFKARARISKAKMPLLESIQQVIALYRNYWPLSVRFIHYRLLNNPPLRHASKPDSVYENTKQSYKDADDLITRARLVGSIPFRVIADETRPVSIGDLHRSTRPFIRRELDWFLKDYRRDLQQSQAVHIEIVGEKNTVKSILDPVAQQYCTPMTIGRGYSSLPPRYEMARRFKASGKDKLVLLVVSDFDPDGEQICNSFARSMRDDFGIANIEAIKVALTREQVERYNLPPNLEAKPKSANYKKFVAKYGVYVSELESLSPEVVQQELCNTIDSVMDCRLFNTELQAEKEDAAFLEDFRRKMHHAAMQLT